MSVKNELAPGLLLAAPSLHDPNFERMVVLLGRHGSDGALGWVVNGRQLLPVRELFVSSKLVADVGALPARPAFSRNACVGGPVAPAAGWIVYRRSGAALVGEIAVGPGLGVSGEMGAFAALASSDEPPDFRLLLGCAGWAPGQLEAEIGAGAWLPAAVDVDLVLDTPAEEMWDQAYRRSVGADPASFSSRRGQA